MACISAKLKWSDMKGGLSQGVSQKGDCRICVVGCCNSSYNSIYILCITDPSAYTSVNIEYYVMWDLSIKHSCMHVGETNYTY